MAAFATVHLFNSKENYLPSRKAIREGSDAGLEDGFGAGSRLWAAVRDTDEPFRANDRGIYALWIPHGAEEMERTLVCARL